MLSTLGTQLTSARADAGTLADAYVGGLLYDPSTLVAQVAAAASALEAVQADVTQLSGAGIGTKALGSALSALRAQLAAVSAYAGELEAAYN